MDRANRDRKPFFASNSTRMHIWTRLAPEAQDKTGLGIYPDGMVEYDGQVGQLLKKLDDLGIANSTIVIYTTDNGAETFTWPDGGTTPFRSEGNTNWEGSDRVPALLRWPGLMAPRSEINDIVSAEDRVQTLTAAAGEPDIASKLLQGYRAGGKTRCTSTATTSATSSPAGAPPSARVLLLDRRRQFRRPALRPIQGRVSWNRRPTVWRSGCSRR
jgi:arylsulfatase